MYNIGEIDTRGKYFCAIGFFLRMMLTHFKSFYNWFILDTKFKDYKIIKRGKLKMVSFDKSCRIHKWNIREAEEVTQEKIGAFISY